LPPVDEFAGETLAPSSEMVLQSALLEFKAGQGQPYYDPAADAAERTRYYGSLEQEADRLKPGELASRLTALVTKTHSTKLKYDPVEYLYPVVDVHEDGKLHSIYSGKKFTPEEAIRHDLLAAQVQEKRIQALSLMSAPQMALWLGVEPLLPLFNCEHVVPQGWFDRREPMRGDLHHLFACDPICNSLRGNLPYYEARRKDFGGESMRDCGKVNDGETRFEPSGGKGPVARATLYFLLRYPGVIRGKFSSEDIAMLVRWSREDPVTDYERHRNVEIAKRQGNRNPLIDHPEWVDKIGFRAGP